MVQPHQPSTAGSRQHQHLPAVSDELQATVHWMHRQTHSLAELSTMNPNSEAKSGHDVDTVNLSYAHNAHYARRQGLPDDSLDNREDNVPFELEPLSRERDEIRLLKLSTKPEHGPLPFELSLIVTDLDSAPAFGALSYEWGSAEEPKTIHINGRPMCVRNNLYDFLMNYDLKHESRSWFLWIDQICIDQDSVEERNHQVQRMAQIYAAAEQVLVWLGKGSQAQETFDFVTRYVDARVRYSIFGNRVEKSMTRQELDYVRCLYRCSYWTRHWIAQEIFVSRYCTVFYDRARIPWTTLMEFNLQYGWREDSPSVLTYLRGVCFVKEEGLAEFSSVMDYIIRSKCLDPRDKVYGIQHILGPHFQITVDYALSTEQVFCEAVFLYLHRVQNITALIMGRSLVHLCIGMGFMTLDNPGIYALAGRFTRAVTGRGDDFDIHRRMSRCQWNLFKGNYLDALETLSEDLPDQQRFVTIWKEGRQEWARNYSIDIEEIA